MVLGNEDTSLEAAEIVRNTVSHITFDGSGNVSFGDGELQWSTTGSSGEDTVLNVSADNTDANVFRVGTGNDQLGFDFRYVGTDTGNDNTLEVFSDNSGNSVSAFRVYQDATIDIPSGDLTDGTNIIYDQSESHVPSSIVQTSGLDADTVDGFDSSELRNANNVAQLTSTNVTLDINQSTWTDIPFDSQLKLDGAYSHDASGSPETITFDEGGTYKVYVSLSYESTDSSRVNPGVKFNLNGTRLETFGLTGYVRNASGHEEASNTVSRVVDVNAGDTLKVQTLEMGESGTATMRSQESVLLVEQLSASASLVSDADTLDGLDSTAFVKTDGSTVISGQQNINRPNGNDFLRLANTTSGDNWDFTLTGNNQFQLDVNDTLVFEADETSQQVTFPSRVTGSAGFDAGGSSIDNSTEVNTTGSGSASFDVYDSANGQDIAQFNEGGNVAIPNGSLSVSDAAGSSFIAESGDSMSGRLSMDGNDVYFQPDSAGGSVTGLTFESNMNAGSDFGYVEYHDDYFGGGEESAIVLRTENDPTDKIVLDGAGGTYVETGPFDLASNDLEDSGTTIWDTSAAYIPQGRLQNDSLTVAGNSVSLGESTSVSHSNLTGIGSTDHHSRYSDSEAVSAVESDRVQDIGFDNIEDPSRTRAIGIDDSEGPLFKDSGGSTYSLWNSKYVSGGTDISISGGVGAGGGSVTIDHANTSGQGNVSAPAGGAISDVNLDGNGHVTSLSTVDFDSRFLNEGGDTMSGNLNLDEGLKVGSGIGSGSEYSIEFGGSDMGLYSDVDFVFYESDGTTEVFRVQGNNQQVEVSAGDLLVTTDNRGVKYGANQDFHTFYDSASDELVLRDETNGVDLIRQPKAGSTQFLQGIDAGSIEAPEDSFTQVINASNTSASLSGDTVGYTFAVDNQSALEVSATSDGSGGLSSGPSVEITNPTNDASDFSGNDGTSGQLLQTDGSNVQWVDFSGGVTDHGNLTGLGDDDHTQYLLANGNRALNGQLNVDGNGINFNDPSNSSAASGAINIGFIYFQNQEWSDTPQTASTLAYDASEGFLMNDNVDISGELTEGATL